MNAEEWWIEFDASADKLRALVEKYHPGRTLDSIGDTGGITAPTAEAVCESVRRRVRREGVIDPMVIFDSAVQHRNIGSMLKLLSDAWFGLPESLESRRVPGFRALCYLCEGVDE